MSSDINVQTFSGKVNINNNLLVGSSHLFVDTINNRVGITTASPDAGLHVNSNAYVHTDFRVGSGIVMNDTNGRITAGSFVGDGSAMTGINSDSGSWAGAGTGSVYLSTSTDKVGIGKTPSEKLDVEGIIRVNRNGGSLQLVGTDHTYIEYYPDGVSSGRKAYVGYSGGSDNNFTISNSAGSGHVILAGGSVGIGTTSPSSRLTVNEIPQHRDTYDHSLAPMTITNRTPTSNSTLNDPQHVLNLAREGTSGEAYGARATFKLSRYENSGTGSRTRFDLNLAHDSYNEPHIMTFRSDGNVGIGNTTPAFPLTIGAGDGNKILFNESTTPGHNITCSSGWQWNFNAARSGQDDDAKITFNISGSSGYDEMMRVNHTGVGIGTTDPAGTLHVKADNRVHITEGTTPAFTGLESVSQGRSQLVLSSDYSDLVIASSRINNAHGSTLSFTTVNPSNTADYRKFVINQGNWGTRKQFLEFGYEDSSVPNPHVAINSTDTVLTMDGINKRVGIGTRTPSYTLDVQGDINSSGKINIGDWAVVEGYMASRTLTLGSTSSNYGGGNNWNTNTAALLFECADNTEIAVHDSGTRVASLMYFEGASTNRITIGRNMGWGTIASVRMYGSQSYPNRPVAMVGKTNGRVYTPNVIVYNNVIYNDGGLYNASNGRFTAPAGYAGYYLVTYTGLAGERELGPNTRWQLNGNDLSWGAAHFNIGSGVNMNTTNARLGLSTQFIYYLNAGDYLTHRVIGGSIYGSSTTHSTTVVMFMGSR